MGPIEYTSLKELMCKAIWTSQESICIAIWTPRIEEEINREVR